MPKLYQIQDNLRICENNRLGCSCWRPYWTIISFRKNLLLVDPVYKNRKYPCFKIINFHQLCLALQKCPVECSVEENRIVAQHRFMDCKLSLLLVFADANYDNAPAMYVSDLWSTMLRWILITYVQLGRFFISNGVLRRDGDKTCCFAAGPPSAPLMVVISVLGVWAFVKIWATEPRTTTSALHVGALVLVMLVALWAESELFKMVISFAPAGGDSIVLILRLGGIMNVILQLFMLIRSYFVEFSLPVRWEEAGLHPKEKARQTRENTWCPALTCNSIFCN